MNRFAITTPCVILLILTLGVGSAEGRQKSQSVTSPDRKIEMRIGTEQQLTFSIYLNGT